MSASPTKAMSELMKESTDSFVITADGPVSGAADSPLASSREALQALLAFSTLHEQVRHRRAQESSAAVPSSENLPEEFLLDEVLQLVAVRALAVTGADGVAIALAEGNRIVCRASTGRIAPDRGMRLNLNSSFSGACFSNAEIVRCDDSETDARVDMDACRRLGTRSMVAAPLVGRRTVIGVLEAFSAEAYGFNDCDVRNLNLLAELTVAAIKPEEEGRLEEISQSAVEQEKSVAPEKEAIPEPAIAIAQASQSSLSAENQEPLEERPEPEVEPAANLQPASSESARPGLVLVFVVVAVAALAGAGFWWKLHRIPQPLSEQRARPASTAPQPLQPALESQDEPLSDIDTGNASPDEEKLAVLPKVTGIRHWSATGSSTVVIDLQDQVQYEAHRLTGPDRIYFDLHDTSLAAGLVGRIIEIRDPLLVRVRVAQPMPGVTRVVLETASDSNFSISLETNPYRLVAELRAIGAKTQSKAQFDLFRPQSEKPQPSLGAPAANSEDAQLRAHVPKLRIVVDAGHGGWDLGTVGRKGLLEKDLVLDIAQRLGSLLQEQLNAEVIYTRQDDTYIPLEDRAGVANQADADLFVSVHANYSDSATARGVETYYTNTFSSVNARSRTATPAQLQDVNWGKVDIREKVQESRRFAISVQHALYAMLAQKNPEIRNRGVKEASYVVLTGTSMPAILAEVSFVSSPTDENNLQSAAYRQQIATALYKGIARYAAASHHVKLASTSAKPAGK